MSIAADRLSVRWYLGYDLSEPLPDHSSLTKIRDRYGVTIFRCFFDAIVDRCQQAGLVWGKELYFDATQVEANADYDRMQPRFYVEAVNAHLADLFPQDEQASARFTKPPAHVEQLPLKLPREVQTEPRVVPLKRQNWIAQMGRPDRDTTYGSYRRLADVWVSTTDPDATLMHKKGGGSHLGYHTHYGVDGGKARIILAVLVTPSTVMENQPFLDLLWRSRFRWHLDLAHVTGDTTYGTIENIVALANAGIRSYMPLSDCGTRPGCFGKTNFIYDAAHDVYVCPHGAILRRFSTVTTERMIKYQALAATCTVCPFKARCTTSEKGRILRRSFDESYLDQVRGHHATEAYKKAMRKRKVWVEPLFGEGKAWHGLARFRLRLLEKVNIEALVIATGQNLKRLLSWRGWGRRGWPGGAMGVAIPADF
ncbi:MAG: IS1182 family transposase [Chloroflexota bacterium]|nr:IS1182 family transposase [Chloroflexota bacterium]